MWWGNKFLIFSFAFLVILSSCKKAPPEAKVEPKKRASQFSLPKPVEEEKFLYASLDKRDPFVPLVDKRGRPVEVVGGGIQFKISDLYLEGIIWDDVKPMAIINGEVVAPGDKVSGVTVVEIKKDMVILNYQDKEFELKME
jgi:hypothetical protein